MTKSRQPVVCFASKCSICAPVVGETPFYAETSRQGLVDHRREIPSGLCLSKTQASSSRSGHSGALTSGNYFHSVINGSFMNLILTDKYIFPFTFTVKEAVKRDSF